MRWTSTLLPHLCLWSLSINGWITSSLSTNGRQHQQQGNSGNWTVKQGTAAELGGEATAPGLAESCFRRAPPPSAWTWQRRELACEVVRKSLVLLKNGKDSEKPFLPLDRNAKKILVAGTHSDDLGYQCGGETELRDGSGVKQARLHLLRRSKNLRRRPVNSGHLLGLAWQLGVAVPSSARCSDAESPPVVQSLSPVSGENGTSANIFFDTLMVEKVGIIPPVQPPLPLTFPFFSLVFPSQWSVAPTSAAKEGNGYIVDPLGITFSRLPSSRLALSFTTTRELQPGSSNGNSDLPLSAATRLGEPAAQRVSHGDPSSPISVYGSNEAYGRRQHGVAGEYVAPSQWSVAPTSAAKEGNGYIVDPLGITFSRLPSSRLALSFTTTRELQPGSSNGNSDLPLSAATRLGEPAAQRVSHGDPSSPISVYGSNEAYGRRQHGVAGEYVAPVSIFPPVLQQRTANSKWRCSGWS
nr:uncharacterized protein LOC109163575 isoform X1 [Ipomoea trifida]